MEPEEVLPLTLVLTCRYIRLGRGVASSKMFISNPSSIITTVVIWTEFMKLNSPRPSLGAGNKT